MNIPKIINVIAEKKMILKVTFSNGIIKHFNCNMIINRNEYYHKLKNPGFFKNVHIDPGGYGLSWDDEVDISEYEIYTNGY